MSCQKPSQVLIQEVTKITSSGQTPTYPPNTAKKSLKLWAHQLTRWNISYDKLLMDVPLASNGETINLIISLTYSSQMLITINKVTACQPTLPIFEPRLLFFVSSMMYYSVDMPGMALLKLQLSDNIVIHTM